MITNNFLKFIIATVVLVVLVAVFGATANASNGVAKTLPKYQLHARCAQLAFIMKHGKLTELHLEAVKNLKPENATKEDVAFQQGYIHGYIIAQWFINNDMTKKARIALAKKSYINICPTVV